jgi:murein DD-endopeptidase MepM/ murein hydrolase activator NlpD
MRLPFRGEWYVFWGGDNAKVNYHVGTRNQRRAADLVIYDSSGKSHRGDGKKNEDYYCYGQELLAAADGTVVTAIDGVPDNVPGSMNPYSVVGNCLIIEQGPHEYSVYCHFQPGTQRVKKGDAVKQGQVLGLCGNSGNSSEPHLHFHMQNTAVLQDATGFAPYFLDVTCRREGKTLTESEYTFLRGDRIQTKAAK